MQDGCAVGPRAPAGVGATLCTKDAGVVAANVRGVSLAGPGLGYARVARRC